MNATELKLISNYMEANDLKLIGLAMLPEEIAENAFYSFPNLTASLSNGQIVAVANIDVAEILDELDYIENNFETLMTFEKENYKVVKLF